MNDIIGMIPVDKKAAIVTGKGIYYERKKCKSNNIFDVPHLSKHPVPKGQTNFIHHRQGRITVLYYHGKNVKKCLFTRNSTGARRNLWMCRCDCGKYTSRTTRSLRRSTKDDMCDLCKIQK